MNRKKKDDKLSFGYRLKVDMKRNWSLYLLVLPVVMLYILFQYKPMYGIIIAFENYRPALGMTGSEWVGFEHFARFFNSPYSWKLIRNTLMISLYEMVFSFPMPIILALLLNEVRHLRFKKFIQTITYLPHFISTVVICSMVTEFCYSTGIFNDIIEFFGGARSNLLANPDLFRGIYTASGVWQGVGWGSIIYLAALTGIDQQLYEAAAIDGANKWKQAIHITIPGLAPVIVLQFILKMGSLMSVGYEKVMLLYSNATLEKADVISTYVYRYGLAGTEWSYSAAIGLFNGVVNCILLIMANRLSRKVSESTLW